MSAAFVTQLLAVARAHDITRNPFVQGIVAGRYPKPALRAYAQDLVGLAAGFPALLATLLARCDHAEARQVILGNLLEEEGAVSFSAAEGLVLAPERCHTALGERFVRAMGADATELRPAPSQWLLQELEHGRWLGPLAYVSVGIEANIPDTFRLLFTGLREHYGLQVKELEFLSEHFDADERHGLNAATVIATAANTKAAQQEALTGAKRGGAAWWHLHLRHARRLRTLVSEQSRAQAVC
jgi:pyrroloquinoline quinone (PQQ) biosynthesis protein C